MSDGPAKRTPPSVLRAELDARLAALDQSIRTLREDIRQMQSHLMDAAREQPSASRAAAKGGGLVAAVVALAEVVRHLTMGGV